MAEPRRLLVVVAHPDDETFGTGSIIAHHARQGIEVTVCCATRGEAGEAPDWLPGEADLGEVREGELRRAAATLGAADVVVLGFGDSGMTGPAADTTLAGAPFDSVVAAVRDVVDRVDPGVVVTLDPVDTDGHRDHARIGQASIEACAGRAGIAVYAWTVARPVLARWFEELELLRPETEHLDLDREGFGRPEQDITTVVDTSDVLDVRLRASAQHRSQTPPFDGMSEDLRTLFLTRDTLVRIWPPWSGGQVEDRLSWP
ncbi:MAG TPA: PIG-L deacetylase family protein [Actinomycetes bacterium]|nr:PIG-L deacetylase family protein [Actinomycetes bacterium]